MESPALPAQQDLPMDLADEFLGAAATPAVGVHEEWLLRICSQLMHREAAVVRMLEQQASWAAAAYHAPPAADAPEAPPPPPSSSSRRSRCRRPSRPLDTSTDPSTATPPGSSSA